jgi:hypothetical protein
VYKNFLRKFTAGLIASATAITLTAVPAKADMSELDSQYLFWVNKFLRESDNHMINTPNQVKTDAGLKFCLTLSDGTTSYKDMRQIVIETYAAKGYTFEQAKPVFDYFVATALASVNSYCPQYKKQMEESEANTKTSSVR